MIIRLTAHRSSTDIAVVHAGPELAEFMGAFPAARWQPQAKAYWLPVEQLDAFGRYARIKDHVLVDDRAKGEEPEKFTGPAPECGACGFPATRKTALELTRCPNCGAVWRPMTFEASGPVALRVECSACGRKQRAGHAFCGGCGAPATPPPAGAPRPVELEPQAHRDEPMLFADAVPEHLEAGMAEVDERDFAKRAAGDR